MATPTELLVQHLHQSMQSYLQWVDLQKHLSAKTCENYARDLHLLMQMMQKNHLTDVRAITSHHIRQIIMQLHSQEQSPKSIARYLSSWRSYYRWMVLEQGLPVNPVLGLRAPKAAKSLPKALSVDDAVRLSASSLSPSSSRAGLGAVKPELLVRDHALIELLYSSGLRVSEIVALDIAPPNQHTPSEQQGDGWLDLNELQVHVLGKGSKPRIVPVGTPAAQAVRAWLEVRASMKGAAQTPAMFIGQNGTRLTARSIQLRLAQYAQALGLPVHVHPHMLRHSFATHILQSSGDLRAVQEMLGHANLSATQIYTALDFQHLAKIYDAAHPRAKKK